MILLGMGFVENFFGQGAGPLFLPEPSYAMILLGLGRVEDFFGPGAGSHLA
jgi:hypothetical protein